MSAAVKHLVLALLCALLAACGGGDPEDDDRRAEIPAPGCAASRACQ